MPPVRLVVLLAAFFAAGCSPDGAEPNADAEQRDSRPAPSSTAVDATGTEAPTEARRTYSFCKDGLNEGGAIDLAGAQVKRNGDVLNVTWNLTDGPPEAGTVLYSMTLVPDDGSGSRQYGVKYEDGKQVAYFVFDSATGKQQNVEDEAYLYDGDLQAAKFPLDGLPASFRYSVAATLEGEDVDRCPDADGQMVTYDGP